jgi:predicted transcriptional regulator
MDEDRRPMAEPRPAASLTSGLLARRGDARPAMRRQAIHHLHLPVSAHEDLGWNDIGEDAERALSSSSLPLGLTPPDHARHVPEEPELEQEAGLEADAVSPASAVAPATPSAPAAEEAPTPLSPLTRHLEAIAERINQQERDTAFKPAVARKVTPRPSQAPRPSQSSRVEQAMGRKAAFTLRLDPERHLRLRLLSALQHRSSQHILIAALDALLSQYDQIEDLAGQVEGEAVHMPEDTGLKQRA